MCGGSGIRNPSSSMSSAHEGNISSHWGCITPQEMVRRFWETTLRGGYAGHGETYVDIRRIFSGGPMAGSGMGTLPRVLGSCIRFWKELPPGGLAYAGRRVLCEPGEAAER